VPGQKSLIFDPGDGLTFPELFHDGRTFMFPSRP